MFLMADSAYAPTPAELGAYKSAGGNAWAGYLGSPHAYHPWAASEVQSVLAAGVLFLPVWVGPLTAAQLTMPDGTADANAALASLAAHGLPSHVVALDVEQAAWDASNVGSTEYVRAFAEQCQRQGTDVTLYGSKALCEAVAASPPGLAVPNAVWLAYWTNSEPSPTVLADGFPLGSEWSGPGQRAWQFRGDSQGAVAPGTTKACDLSVCSDGFPMVLPHGAAPVVPAAAVAPVVVDTTAPGWTVTVNGAATHGKGALTVAIEVA